MPPVPAPGPRWRTIRACAAARSTALRACIRLGLPGRQPTDADNNALLLRRLQEVADRRAHFQCVVVALRSADDPEPLIADGRWEGEIVASAQGQGGFGYDPYFWVPALGATAAQLDPVQKNRISHRGRAMQAMAILLRERWGW